MSHELDTPNLCGGGVDPAAELEPTREETQQHHDADPAGHPGTTTAPSTAPTPHPSWPDDWVFAPIAPAWVRESEAVGLVPQKPSLTTPPARHAPAEYIDEMVPLLVIDTSGYECLAGVMVLNSLSWTLPHDRNWWHTGLMIAEGWPHVGNRMLAHMLAMLDYVCETDDAWHWAVEESASWARLVDPDDALTREQTAHITDYIHRPTPEKVEALHAEYLRWLPVVAKLAYAQAAGKLSAVRSTGCPTISDSDLIEALSELASPLTGDHCPEQLPPWQIAASF